MATYSAACRLLIACCVRERRKVLHVAGRVGMREIAKAMHVHIDSQVQVANPPALDKVKVSQGPRGSVLRKVSQGGVALVRR